MRRSVVYGYGYSGQLTGEGKIIRFEGTTGDVMWLNIRENSPN
jgi:hypothetical protein